MRPPLWSRLKYFASYWTDYDQIWCSHSGPLLMTPADFGDPLTFTRVEADICGFPSEISFLWIDFHAKLSLRACERADEHLS